MDIETELAKCVYEAHQKVNPRRRLDDCQFHISGHTFDTVGNLYVCKKCGLAVGKEWMDNTLSHTIRF